jgi:hypothetical protein
MRLSWRTQQFRAADRQDTTAALGMQEPWIHRAAVTGHLLLILLVAVGRLSRLTAFHQREDNSSVRDG